MARLAHVFVVQKPLFTDMLTEVVVEGNGNCLFYSLLTGAGRALEDHMILRSLYADFFTNRWIGCPVGSGRRASTYGGRLNDCYSGEPVFHGVNPCFSDAGAYGRYILRDKAWAGTSEIEALPCLWRWPIIVWSSDGLLNPGLIGFVPDVLPIHVVYSNGNHYNAIVGIVSDATAALHRQGAAETCAARANLVEFVVDPLPFARETELIASSPFLESEGLSKPASLKRKADAKNARPLKKDSGVKTGVRKAHNKWRVGIRPDIPGVSRARLTIPFDYQTKEFAERVYQFVVLLLARDEQDESTCKLDSQIVEHLRRFVQQLCSGTIDTHLSKVKGDALSGGQAIVIPKSTLRGVVHDAGCVWLVRVKVRDVMGKEKSFKLPFRHHLEEDAGLAYDFAIVHFCAVIGQKMNHKLNYNAETLALRHQTELKSYVEEMLTNSYSFQVGKTLPAKPILCGVDSDLVGNFWTVRLCIVGCANSLSLFCSPIRFEFLQEAAFAYDHLMPKLYQLRDPSVSFNSIFCDYVPPNDLVAR
jgi:hypothetical protein